MRVATKRMALRVATAVAVACTAAVIFLPATAFSNDVATAPYTGIVPLDALDPPGAIPDEISLIQVR